MRLYYSILFCGVALILVGCTTAKVVRPPVAKAKRHLVSAHRGGRGIPMYPENAVATFDFVHDRIPSAWIECDVQMSADSVLLLMHDYSLDRTTTASGQVSELAWSVIDTAHLVDDFGVITEYEVPTFEEALAWAKAEKATFTVDVKRGVPFERVVRTIEAYELVPQMIVISYNPEDARTIYDLNPKLLISVGITNEAELDAMLASGVPIENWVAFTGTRLADPELFDRLHDLGVSCIVGTLGGMDAEAQSSDSPAIYYRVLSTGADVLATDRPLEAYEAIRAWERN